MRDGYEIPFKMQNTGTRKPKYGLKWSGIIKSILLISLQAIFEPSTTSSLDSGRDIKPDRHLPERHFCLVIKI